MDQKNLFNDLLVIETAGVLAGPAAGTFFAELGARVIKIENPATGGDVTRQWKSPAEDSKSGTSAYYASVNYKKEVQLLDLRDAIQRQQVHKLLQSADILISNYKPGDDVKLGMDPATLHALNPRLIIGRISGFGQDNPRVAYDLVLQAETGFMSMNGTPESGPVKMPVALIDLLAAHQLREGLMAALWQREKTGKGCIVDVSLYAAALASLLNQASSYLMTGTIPEPIGSLHPHIAPYGEQFTCADGPAILLAVGTDKQFAALCRALGMPELATDTRFSANPDRVKHRIDLHRQLAPLFAAHPAENLLQQFISAEVPAAIVRNLAEVFNRPEAMQFVAGSDSGDTGKRVQSVIFSISSAKTS